MTSVDIVISLYYSIVDFTVDLVEFDEENWRVQQDGAYRGGYMG